jgi:glycosyltransferase involved in cell wall biosynthesis
VHDRVYAPNARLHFGFTGRLVAEKGIDLLCALSELPEFADISWHVHGAGADYPPSFFERYPAVVYHGAYNAGVQQAEILESLDAVVLFSRHNEGMPLSLIEAMSAGLPWVATDQGGTREMAASPANCVVVAEPYTRERLATAVHELAVRIRGGVTSRAAQRAAYERSFAPRVVAKAWCDFFELPQCELQSA